MPDRTLLPSKFFMVGSRQPKDKGKSTGAICPFLWCRLCPWGPIFYKIISTYVGLRLNSSNLHLKTLTLGSTASWSNLFQTLTLCDEKSIDIPLVARQCEFDCKDLETTAVAALCQRWTTLFLLINPHVWIGGRRICRSLSWSSPLRRPTTTVLRSTTHSFIIAMLYMSE